MALITCQECEKSVSDKATTCPNCGAPINDRTTKIEFTGKSLKVHRVLSLVTLLFVAPFLGLISQNMTTFIVLCSLSFVWVVYAVVASWWNHG